MQKQKTSKQCVTEAVTQPKEDHGYQKAPKKNHEQEDASENSKDQTQIHKTRGLLTEDDILKLIKEDPDSLRSRLPKDHIDQTTIDIAVDWSNTSSCDSCLEQVAELLRKSLEQQ